MVLIALENNFEYTILEHIRNELGRFIKINIEIPEAVRFLQNNTKVTAESLKQIDKLKAQLRGLII